MNEAVGAVRSKISLFLVEALASNLRLGPFVELCLLVFIVKKELEFKT
jgi:hypothetical protein